ncbi:MarR family winged helix-turn-helix transcriptional regulator [Paraglaciecola sp.]|uniref:MarR family winged helix-turn-helix transcriptional regulator n=1 Tax=Paraglaciecola sp. TaxID=1920173 RepID=UPI00273E05F6|nr:MarR family winged helix-turn-helix transcriptional regulator [Paraglaciecola sp.]MDP5033209.1 MarR family winged helix-turn-helix transcriptional regulator [Paraglaciecola sp.]
MTFDLRHRMMPSHFKGVLGLVEKNLASAYKQEDLTEIQFQILDALSGSKRFNNQEFSQKLLVQVTGLPKHKITRNLDILEQRKLLMRVDDKLSRRCKNIHLTEEGSKLAYEVSAIYNKACADVFSVLSDDECSMLQKLLLKLRGV